MPSEIDRVSEAAEPGAEPEVDGFDDLDTVGPLEVLSNAGFAPALVRPADTATTIRSAHGLRLTVDDELTLDAAPASYVIHLGLADAAGLSLRNLRLVPLRRLKVG